MFMSDQQQDSGHAFILRRYDTGAVSATTMFRAAFPTSTDQEEKEELAWVKDSYDLAGNNGSSRDTSIARLAGVWVDPEVALTLGERYGLGRLVTGVVDATPSPTANYRRSGKSNVTPKGSESSHTVAPTPLKTVSTNKTSSTPSKEPPTKRIKQSSPAPRSPSPATHKPSPAPRRSMRAKSPSLRAAAIEPLKAIKTPKKSSSRREVVVDMSGGSEQTVVDEDANGLEKVINHDLHTQDIAEQKELIQGLKAQRAAAQDMDTDTTKSKRTREEEQALTFNPKPQEIEPRAIATNRRVSRFQMEPKTKSAAWGAAVFVVGVAAA